MKKNIFSDEHIREALRYSQQDDTKITRTAPVFLAAVLQHVTRHVLDKAYKTNKIDTDTDENPDHDKSSTVKRIRQEHLQECFQKDKSLQMLLGGHFGVYKKLRLDEGEESTSREFLFSEDIQAKQRSSISDCRINLHPALKSNKRRRLNCNKPTVENVPPSTALLGNIVISVMGLPGSMKERFINDLQRVIEINMAKNVTIEISLLPKNTSLFQSKNKVPDELSLAWHTHILTSSIFVLDRCYEKTTSVPNTVCITDCSSIECFSRALTDFANGYISKMQINAYHSFFLDMIRDSVSSQNSSDPNSVSKDVVVLYLAKRAVQCRNSILKMDDTSNLIGIPFVESITQLESMYDRDLEIVSQQSAYQQNAMIVSQWMLLDLNIVYNVLVGFRSKRINLACLTFKETVDVNKDAPAPNNQLRPWLYCSCNTIYDSDESILESYTDLCQGKWSYFGGDITNVIEAYNRCKPVYINQKFWVLRSPYIVDVVFEHLSRGQTIVVYSRLIRG